MLLNTEHLRTEVLLLVSTDGCAMFGGQDSIRDFIAFPKNNSGRDVMLDTPSPISDKQLDELRLIIKTEKEK